MQGETMGTRRKPKCDCHLYERQVCDICQGVTDNEKDREPGLPEYGYHTHKIEKGKIGYSSKIREELEELVDAESQNVKILIHCELADLYGALKAYAMRVGLTMDDLKEMEALTHNAFKQGHR
jgi:phosphoribosyl-ATP pyrophosphohydrolase